MHKNLAKTYIRLTAKEGNLIVYSKLIELALNHSQLAIKYGSILNSGKCKFNKILKNKSTYLCNESLTIHILSKYNIARIFIKK